jgi:8-oxo-dGTP pyrophosphatase MutT (NUDIX family)
VSDPRPRASEDRRIGPGPHEPEASPRFDVPGLRDIVKTVIVGPDGRYLMQHRDDNPRIRFREHWCMFGGDLEPGEDHKEGLRRELMEELEFRPRSLRFFTELAFTVPDAGIDRRRLVVYETDITHDEIAALVLHEGQGMAFMTVAELLAAPKVIPWDLCAVVLHGRGMADPSILPATAPVPGRD